MSYWQGQPWSSKSPIDPKIQHEKNANRTPQSGFTTTYSWLWPSFWRVLSEVPSQRLFTSLKRNMQGESLAKNKPYILLMAEMRRSPVEVGSLNPSIDKVLYITGAKKTCKTLDAFHIFSLFSASVSFQKINRRFHIAWRTPLPRKDGVPAQKLASDPCSNSVNREECEKDKTFVFKVGLFPCCQVLHFSLCLDVPLKLNILQWSGL